MEKYQIEIKNQIDSMPIEEARIKIASGDFGGIGSPAHAFASSWLAMREANLRDDREATVKSSDKVIIDITSADTWNEIEKEYEMSKRSFGKKINFVRDTLKRKVIFRDVEQAFLLANNGFYKPSVILAGGVIEELLRLYLAHKGVKPKQNKLDTYIRACESNGRLESAIHKLADSIRQFRNIVHLERESSTKHTISKAKAKGAVSSVFTIVDDFDT